MLEKPALHLAFGFPDGMSVIMVLLTVIVTLAAVLSGKAPAGREKLYFGSSLLISGGALGAFAATDLFFFFAFHELALIPTFLMIGMLGRGDRRTAAWKITIYLGLGSIILFAGLVWLANLTGTYDMGRMVAAAGTIDPAAQKGIAALLLVGFGTLVSLFPFHSWAAPAYASAPAPVAMLHAGVLKKFGLYGLLRLAIPLVPDGLQAWLTPLLVLLLGNILWVGFVTISQKRLDGMLGNSSVMHMGYIFLAIAALIAFPENPLAQPAAVLLMFAHGVSIALLFGLADRIERNTGIARSDRTGRPRQIRAQAGLHLRHRRHGLHRPARPRQLLRRDPGLPRRLQELQRPHRPRPRADRLHPLALGRGHLRGLHAPRLSEHLPRPVRESHRVRRGSHPRRAHPGRAAGAGAVRRGALSEPPAQFLR